MEATQVTGRQFSLFQASLLIALVLTTGFLAEVEAQNLYASTRATFIKKDATLFAIERIAGSDLNEIGALLIGGATTVTARGMAMDPVDGSMYLSIHGDPEWQLCTVDLDTAETTVVGSFASHMFRDLTFDSTGQLYGVTGGDGVDFDSLFKIDKTSGVTTFVAALSGYSSHGIAFDPSQPDLLFHFAIADPGQLVFETIDLETNVLTLISLEGDLVVDRPGGLVWDPISSVFRFVDSFDDTYYSLTRDGVLSEIGAISGSYHGLAFDQTTTSLEVIFYDGFGSGGPSAWSDSTPQRGETIRR